MTVQAATPATVREAREMLAYFTNASEGAAVMDGAGTIWHHSSGLWYSGPRHRLRQASPVDLARALCPDLAEHMAVAS